MLCYCLNCDIFFKGKGAYYSHIYQHHIYEATLTLATGEKVDIKRELGTKFTCICGKSYTSRTCFQKHCCNCNLVGSVEFTGSRKQIQRQLRQEYQLQQQPQQQMPPSPPSSSSPSQAKPSLPLPLSLSFSPPTPLPGSSSQQQQQQQQQQFQAPCLSPGQLPSPSPSPLPIPSPSSPKSQQQRPQQQKDASHVVLHTLFALFIVIFLWWT